VVTVLEGLGLPYDSTFLEFGELPGGVESEDFLKRYPARRVPLPYDVQTSKPFLLMKLLKTIRLKTSRNFT
jgi:hypothetical protein